MELIKIMLVSTDTEFVRGVEESLKDEFEIVSVDNAEEALKVLGKTHGFKLVLSGFNLPGMNGHEFLAIVRKKHPRILRLMATGDTVFANAVAAINTSHVFNLQTKPCPPEILRTVLKEAVARQKKGQDEVDTMRDTMFGTVKMLVDVLELTNPVAVRRSKRIRRRAQKICAKLKAMPLQMMDMVVLLSNIGCVGLPAALLKKMEKGVDLTKAEAKAFRTHPSIAARLLEHVPRMDKIAEIVRHQNTPAAKNPPLAARILKACIDMDQMEHAGAGADKILDYMRAKPEKYDPKVVESLARHVGKSAKAECNYITVADLEPGMVMQTDMVTEKGVVLLHKGEILSEASHLRLQTFADLLKVKEPVGACLPS